MRRWALRGALVLLFLWIARTTDQAVPVFLGYLLWAYLVWRAWPAIRADLAAVWGYGVPLRESLSRARPGRDRNAGF